MYYIKPRLTILLCLSYSPSLSPSCILSLVFGWDWPISLMVLFKIKFVLFLNNCILCFLPLCNISVQRSLDQGDKSVAKHHLSSPYEVHYTFRSRKKGKRSWHVSVTLLILFLDSNVQYLQQPSEILIITSVSVV